jgi:predicted lysophospholipase L1 biosynthesis ABC-type transport system permease subunit
MVADFNTVRSVAARVPFVTDAVHGNEAWLVPGAPGTLTRDSLAAGGVNPSEILIQEELRAEAASDPLVAASWEGILFLSFTAVLGLTALGFAVYVVLAARARSLEFAILRTMGYSSRQVIALVTFEQAFVIIAGVVVGTALGFPLGRLMIGYLGVTETGRDPLPPIISQVSWVAVATVYTLLGLVFLLTVVALARTYSRVAVSRALRIGEI